MKACGIVNRLSDLNETVENWNHIPDFCLVVLQPS